MNDTGAPAPRAPLAIAARATVDARATFITAAAQVLASSLDFHATLEHLARLATPSLGDMCIVDLVEDGTLRRVSSQHAVAAKRALLETLHRAYPPSADSPQPAGRVMRSGTPELIPVTTPDVVAAHTFDAAHAELIRAIGVRSHLAVPMIAHGTLLGVISLGITESDDRYTPADVACAEDFARLAALAVANARLYADAQAELAERRHAEAALRLSESRFRGVLEQSPLAVQIFEPSGRPVQVNAAWERLWGVRLEDIPEYNVLTDPQLERLGVLPQIRVAFAGEAVSIPPVRYDPDATLPGRTRNSPPARWVRSFAYPVKDAAGAVREVILVHDDVSATIAAEERLHAADERLRLALTASRMNVWDWDLVTNVVECSENAREFWGIDVGHADAFLQVIRNDDLERVRRAFDDALKHGDAYMVEYRVRRDGGDRWAQSRGTIERDAAGAPRRLLGITVDITELKDAEAALRLLAEAGETLNESLDSHSTLSQLARIVVPRLSDWCALDLLSSEGGLQRVAVYHPDPERVALATRLFAQYPPLPSNESGAWRVIRTGRTEWAARISDELLVQAAHDETHLAALRTLGLRSYICVPLVARGAPIGILTLVHAESGRHYDEDDVRLAEELARRVAAAVDNARLHQQLRDEHRRKDEFLATLAHELRNPLAPIRTGLAIFRATSDQAVVARTQDMLERQLEHLVRLVDDLLDLSRITSGKVRIERSLVGLRTVVATALETSRPLLDAAAVDVHAHLPDDDVLLDADRTRLAQVLSNLLNNAAKFSPRGGRIDLRAAAGPEGLRLEVTDTGIGIPADMLDHIFEMFTQINASDGTAQGLGIGLTLVKRLVELHGGRIWAASQGLGSGSTFVVVLPPDAIVRG